MLEHYEKAAKALNLDIDKIVAERRTDKGAKKEDEAGDEMNPKIVEDLYMGPFLKK